MTTDPADSRRRAPALLLLAATLAAAACSSDPDLDDLLADATAVGSPAAETSGSAEGLGAAYVFGSLGDVLEIQQKIGAFVRQDAAHAESDQRGFGAAVAISGGRVIIGAPESVSSAGSAAIDVQSAPRLPFSDGFEGGDP